LGLPHFSLLSSSLLSSHVQDKCMVARRQRKNKRNSKEEKKKLKRKKKEKTKKQ